MTKTEKTFQMLRYIKECPDLNPQDLAKLCDVSERGVYRYVNTLSKAGSLSVSRTAATSCKGAILTFLLTFSGKLILKF